MDRPDQRKEESIMAVLGLFKSQGYTYEEVQRRLNEIYRGEKTVQNSIPITVLENRKLSSLEAIVKHLKESEGLKLSEIAKLLGRDQRAIGVTYRSARSKVARKMSIRPSAYNVPLEVIADRRLSVLESVVNHLKEYHQLRLSRIAVLIKRDVRTVWTVSRRIENKKKH